VATKYNMNIFLLDVVSSFFQDVFLLWLAGRKFLKIILQLLFLKLSFINSILIIILL